jgi:hypothetical protein
VLGGSADVLLWSAIINYGVLLVWFVVFRLGHDWMHGLHSKFFALSVETFDAIHYGAMSVYKIGILLFALVPYLALLVVG